MPIFIDADAGSDSPSGGTTDQKLATIQTAAGALKTFVGLAALCITKNARFLDGKTVVVSGTVRPTISSSIDNGYALFSVPTTGVPDEIRQWTAADGTPPSGALSQFTLRGDAQAVPTFRFAWNSPTAGCWSLVDAATGLALQALPTGITAAKVSSVLVYADGFGGSRGERGGALELVANVAAVVATPNSYYIDASRFLYLNFTDGAGTQVTSGSSQAIDSNDPGCVSLCFMPDGSVSGSAVNGLLCFQSADRPCKIHQFVARNTGRATNGMYAVSFEGSSGMVIYEPIAVDGTGHHSIGNTSGGTGSTIGVRLRNMSAGRAFYAVNSGFACISCYSDNILKDYVAEDCVYKYGPVLRPDGKPLALAAAQSSGWGNFSSNTAGGLIDARVKRCWFEPMPPMAPASSANNPYTGGVNINNTADIAGDISNPDSYPIVFEDCVFGPHIGTVINHNGTGLQTSNMAITRSLLQCNGAAQRSNAGAGGGSCIIQSAASAWTGGTPVPRQRSLLIDRSVVLLRTALIQPGYGVNLIESGVSPSNMRIAFRARRSVFINMSGNPRNSNTFWFAFLNATTDHEFDIQDCVFINVVANYGNGTPNGTRKLLLNDGTAIAGSNQVTFKRNTYIGFTHFSSNASYTSKAQWLASIDPDGQFADKFTLTDDTLLSRIESLLGSSWLSGTTIRPIIQAACAGHALPPINIRRPVPSARNGRYIG